MGPQSYELLDFARRSLADADVASHGSRRQALGEPLPLADRWHYELVDGDRARAPQETGGRDRVLTGPRAREIGVHDVWSDLSESAHVCPEATPVMIAARSRNYARGGDWTRGGDPLDDRPRDAEHRHLDGRVEARQHVRQAQVGAAALDVVRVCDQPQCECSLRSQPAVSLS